MDLSPLAHPRPVVLQRRRFRGSKYLQVEQLDLRFHNGTEATYECICGGHGAVMAVPYDGRHFYLVSEYAVGVEGYELGLVKGKIDAGEDPARAVVRELEEEIGFGASRVEALKQGMTVAPGMMTLTIYPFLCTELFAKTRPGDEPEHLGIIRATPAEVEELCFDPQGPLREARSIAVLLLALRRLGQLPAGRH